MRHHHQLAIFSFIVACYFLVRFLALQLSSNEGPTTPSSDATATAPSHSLVSHHGIGYLHLDVKDYSSGCPKPKQALIAVFTTASAQDAEKRQLLRQIYQDWNKELEGHDQIDVRFYFGNGVDYNSDMALAAEQALFDDVVVMEEAVEHRDNGKILEWFKYARSVLYSRHPSKDTNYCLRYRFIGKGDVDAVIHIKRLSRILSGLSDDSRYIGRSFVVPHYHMTGMLYLVTSDIVEWINFSPIPKQHLNGVEDVQVGKWLLESKIHFKKAEQYNRFHDLEESPNFPSNAATNLSIVIHWCKDMSRMFRCIDLLKGEPLPTIVVDRLLLPRAIMNRAVQFGLNTSGPEFPALLTKFATVRKSSAAIDKARLFNSLNEILLEDIVQLWSKLLTVESTFNWTNVTHEFAIRASAKRPRTSDEVNQLVIDSILRVHVPLMVEVPKYVRYRYGDAVDKVWEATRNGTVSVDKPSLIKLLEAVLQFPEINTKNDDS